MAQDQGLYDTTLSDSNPAQAALDAAANRSNNARFNQTLSYYQNNNLSPPYDPGGGGMSGYQAAQIELDKQKLQFSRDQLAQQKALEEQKIAEDERVRQMESAQRQREADANTVEAFSKELMGMQGPKDPYGYLFASRGMAAPQGYTPEQLPLAQPVQDMYKQQGINLADAQKSIVGSAGPSFINGYLGSPGTSLQQGPMGFENTPGFKDIAPGSMPQQPPTSMPIFGPPGMFPPGAPPAPTSPTSAGMPKAAGGGVFPGYAPGQDSIVARVSPGEGVLTPQAVQYIGGAKAINALNQLAAFAQGGVVPGMQTAQDSTTNPNTGTPLWSGQSTGPNKIMTGIPPSTGIPSQGLAIKNQASWPGAPTNVPSDGAPKFADGGMVPTNAPTNQLMGSSLPGYQTGGMIDPTQATMAPGWQQMVEQHFAQGGIVFPPTVGSGAYMPSFAEGGILDVGGQQVPPLGAGTGANTIFTPPGSRLGMMNPPNTTPTFLPGGVLNPPAPANPPPMNLNMLDPTTRGLVNMYGVPQVPSEQSWDALTPTEQSAYKSYVSKVAGGNPDDLLAIQKQIFDKSGSMSTPFNPEGATYG